MGLGHPAKAKIGGWKNIAGCIRKGATSFHGIKATLLAFAVSIGPVCRSSGGCQVRSPFRTTYPLQCKILPTRSSENTDFPPHLPNLPTLRPLGTGRPPSLVSFRWACAFARKRDPFLPAPVRRRLGASCKLCYGTTKVVPFQNRTFRPEDRIRPGIPTVDVWGSEQRS
jgi:hypothetical protein